MKKNVALSSFLNISLKLLFLLILVESIVHRNLYYKFSITSLVLSIIAISLVIFVYFYLKKNYSKKLLFIILLSVGLIFRVLWFLNLDSIPVGDFNRMFICAGEFLTGSNYMFRGTSYFARFPHMTATVLYFAIIRNFFSNPLIAIRIINIVLSMFNIILLYMISKEIFKDDKKSFWVLLISALYPPMILYSNVYCSENLAMPLLLLSVLMFFKSINNKQNLLYLCLSGIFLSLSHLFRPNGYVFIIAYIMYLFLYFKENITVKLKNILVVLASFIVPFVLFSTLLIKLNITEYPLWHGTEPPSISILKGTNIASGGKWNEEDFKVFHDCDENYEKADKKAKEIIKERLINTPKLELFKFYVSKFSNFWNNGSFAGDYWSEAGLDEAYNKEDYLKMLGKENGNMTIRISEEGVFYIQSFYIILLALSYVGLYKNKSKRKNLIDLLYILFGGMSLQLLLIESQDRYSYPLSWIFIILAMTAFNPKENEEALDYD
ncbi:ArnT family glycosyltransferase [Clostridium perfringens]|uniref:ArnT family glycosyltransferase n=2 Tax=Clostridium perfringens TaxID=1502 RepID=UPI002148548C|nr:glycosyltransferase family 39 protein [Clostridium perfringens]